jgi:putative endopeptidase
MNIIVFPAAILQAPFYSINQSSSANYGGIGAVIAHEISHAFDNNGAKFDENGNLHNWWTEEDLTQFQSLAQAMIDEFDGIDFAGGKVNGTLTVSENIADAGGLSCALEAAKREADLNLVDFFTNWAKIWRNKATTQYQQLLLNVDVHGPAKLRANIQLQNLDDFFTTFDIQSGDAMYREPEKRVHIW